MMNYLLNPKLVTKIKHRLLGCLLLLCIPLITSAQGFKGSVYDKKIVSINPAAVFSGTGDVYGFGTEISHLKTFAKNFYFKQTLASHIVNGTNWHTTFFSNQTGIDLSAELGISPFKMEKRFLSFSGGICLAYLIERGSSGGGSWYFYNESDDYVEFSSYQPYYREDVVLGFLLGLNYHEYISDYLYLNARASIRSYPKMGTALWYFGFGIGVDFNNLKKK